MKIHIKKPIPISKLLTELHENPEFHKNLTFGKLMDLLDDQAYGIGLLIFALPSTLPVSAIPGISAILGIPLFLLGLQLAFFRKKPWFPQCLQKKKLNPATFTAFLKQAIPYVEKFEKIVKPRYAFFSTRFMKCFMGIVLVFLSILLMLPIPFSNMLLGALIAIIALGLIANDGLVLLLGFISSTLTIIFFWEVLDWFIQWVLKLIF